MIAELCKPGGHPNIVAVFRHGEFSNNALYYFDMELCAANLEQHRLLNEATLTTIEICHILRQIAGGVAFIHDCGKVHRDLKPRNGNSAQAFIDNRSALLRSR